ncbi:MAG TPA: asparaginase [Chloroflexota bacterium]|nr:asparaginase [Chloroflexota bacterium]
MEPAPSLELPALTIISLGGTIAMTQAGGGGVTPTLTGEDLVAAVPALAGVANVTALSFRQLPGAHLTMDDLVSLAAEIERRIEAGAAGIVVIQGTDTIEESAFALDLLLEGAAPVVVTGAMRNSTLPGADGPANILAAAQVAADRAARDLGVLVVLNDEIHAARYVRKIHPTSPSAFASPIAGSLGRVVEGRPRIFARLPGRRHIDAAAFASDRRVALLTVALGDDGRLLEAVREAGYGGLVVEAFGAGHVPATLVEGLGRLAAAMPVVLASRTGGGPMMEHTYGFPGSESDMLGRGLISAGILDGPKARILLWLLLGTGASSAEISREFGWWAAV